MTIRWKAEAASVETYKTIPTSVGRVELRTFDPAHMDITSKHFIAIDGEVVAEFYRRPSGKGLARFQVLSPHAVEKVTAVLVDILTR